ncbi:MAG: BNR-repeat neuraminidase N-terminal domain-containing protein, partial [Sphingobacterium sp.]
MKSLKHLIALFIFSCLLTSLGFAGNITVTYYQLPLLVGEKSTPLIRLSLIADQSDVGKTFSDLRFSFQGTTDIKNIRNIKIYLAQSDSSIMPKLNPSQIIFDQPAGELQHELKLDYKVEKAGVHHFWVTLGIGENADLL